MSVSDTQWIGAFAIAGTACWIDVRTRRIPNWLTFPSAVLGLVAATMTSGGHGILASLLGLLVGLSLFFPLFVLRGLGAGDVKLMGALGAWLGTRVVLGVAFYTALAGGVVALILIVVYRYGQAFRNLWLLLNHWHAFGLGPVDSVTLDTSSGPKLPYALPIALGVALTFWLW